MSLITTHVLDTARGRPAAGIAVRLERHGEAGWTTIAERVTDADGRVPDLLPVGAPVEPGRYRLVFDTGRYLTTGGAKAFYPEITVAFEIHEAREHHHVPLLLSPYGYSTYRGS
ncbi:MAG TPA: hydroxyisourate hydrolase [Dongiaceae bacterium]|nr:hydroxyisourate hydrolase [Dongiaceae bacterium]